MEKGDPAVAIPASAAADAGTGVEEKILRDGVHVNTAPSSAAPSGRGAVAVPGVPPVVPLEAARKPSPPRLAKATPSTSQWEAHRATIAELMQLHGRAILGFCARVLRDSTLAEDVAQQVFLQAYRDLDRFEGRASLRSWLFTIASHRCIDVLRRERARSRWTRDDEQAMNEVGEPRPSQFEQLDQARRLVALEECLALLSPEVRMTLLMRFRSGLSYEDLATSLEARPEALQLRVTRALRRLRGCLERKGWDGE
jgi:RNA polymerase sigma factor (sigma-70 family)